MLVNFIATGSGSDSQSDPNQESQLTRIRIHNTGTGEQFHCIYQAFRRLSQIKIYVVYCTK
jgi:hypothetical protein